MNKSAIRHKVSSTNTSWIHQWLIIRLQGYKVIDTKLHENISDMSHKVTELQFTITAVIIIFAYKYDTYKVECESYSHHQN